MDITYAIEDRIDDLLDELGHAPGPMMELSEAFRDAAVDHPLEGSRVGLAPACPTGIMTHRVARKWLNQPEGGTRRQGLDYYFAADGSRVRTTGFKRWQS